MDPNSTDDMINTFAPATARPHVRLWESAAPEEPVFLHDFFDRAARHWPDHIAVEVPPSSCRSDRRHISYAELKRQADALACALGEFVTGPDCIVVILLPRSSEHLYLAQLAALKAGAAYTCIDPAFPDGQIGAILDDASAVALLTDGPGSNRVRGLRADVTGMLNVPRWAKQRHGPVEPPRPKWLSPTNLAYLIYTSGTTGRPKGVMIEHRSIANLVRGDLRDLGVTPQDRVGQSSSCAYDSSVEETWFALAAGATLVVMDDETTRLGPDLIPWLRRERVTMFCPPPTLLRATGCTNPERELPDLRLVHVGGEALPADLAERWARGRRLVNDYGPTETTVTALRGRIEPGAAITIGRPVPGMTACVLNDALQEVGDGERGELCLAGIGLARGYLNDPALTARKFPQHLALGRIYRTGDLVHRATDGRFYCHGRIDAQVKIRGYRIELEAIEARLMECGGVRAAACQAQGDGTHQRVVAFVVAHDPAVPPASDELKSHLRRVLPEYMVPSQIAILDRLPTTVSGKLDRRALPILNGHDHALAESTAPGSDAMEEKLVRAFTAILEPTKRISVTDDFFNDLGGDSLLAAGLISVLRDDPTAASLTVRDLYEARTVAGLATRVRPAEDPRSKIENARPTGRPLLATIVQAAWLILGLMVGAPIFYLLAFRVLPYLIENLGLVPLLLLTPVLYAAGLSLYTTGTVGLTVLAKKLLVGRYQPLRAPIWGSFYVRNWMVQQVARLVPWSTLEGTVFQLAVLRALGARIGKRVHLHRGVNLLQGGWDLLDIGDDVTLSQDASLRLVELEDGEIVVGPVTLEAGVTLDVRAGVASHTQLEANSCLTALSFLPRGGRIPSGQRWDGIPAKPTGTAPEVPAVTTSAREWSPALHGLALSLGRVAVSLFLILPLELLSVLVALCCGIELEHAAEWLANPTVASGTFLVLACLVLAAAPLTLLLQVAVMRLLGRVPAGVISRWSLAYVRVWLKAGIVESANRWLNGTLLWPIWLRAAGMKIGRGCELSTIIDTIPEMVEVGPSSFLADGIYLAGPRLHRGTVTLAPVRLGKNTYFGNNALIAVGQTIPDDVLFGVSTVTPDTLRPGTSWFGHPPFELPRREIVECDRALTHAPRLLPFCNRVFWELLRFGLPLVPLFIAMGWLTLIDLAEEAASLPVLLLVVLPLLNFGAAALLCLMGLVLKWVLLGRVRPAIHPMWSSWVRRWEFHYTAWDLYTAGPLSALEGTLLLNWFLRAMGMRIGRRVIFGSGAVDIIDHDMLSFEDGATVNCMFQAHTFEDRVLKIDRVRIRQDATVGHGAVLLYGADIGASTAVMPHSVVMKYERLLPNSAYAGCPTQLAPLS